MVNEKKIFQRATIRGLSEYLLYGLSTTSDSKGYTTRMDEAFRTFDDHAKELSGDNADEIGDYANDLVRETTEVYTEIGIQSGILLMMDFMKNTGSTIDISGYAANYEQMYKVLFHGVSDAINLLNDKEIDKQKEVIELLKQVHCRAEEIYINTVK